ncbi:uncharacterized protein LOC110734588 [Chenopodium quinoa]|uniref:uncharacterized protein LOC110734588 n=1 Tax=Chenopodium quinoa TaxID=63459 RepID=UPI000B790FD7|nr:uncharacterized protein LOC110734588 [Chenopodium quinoa]
MSNLDHFQIGGLDITTKVINKSNIVELDQGLRDLLATARKDGVNLTIGLDIEKRYQNIPNNLRPSKEYVSALMFCCGDFCLIIQLYHLTALEFCSVSKFLQLQELTFVGVRIKHCLEALGTSWGIKCRYAVDLRNFAATTFTQSNILGTYKLIDLAVLVSNHVFDKDELFTKCNGAALSDWSFGTLSRHQIEAATWRAYLYFNTSI